MADLIGLMWASRRVGHARAGRAAALAGLCGLGFILVMGTLSAPYALQSQRDRLAARTPVDVFANEAGKGVLFSSSRLILPGGPVEVVAVAGLANAPVPPGLPQLPGTGHAFVSQAVRDDEALLASLDYQIDGSIGAAGLTSPSERLIYVGATVDDMQAALPSDRGFPAFGVMAASDNTVWSITLAALFVLMLPLALASIALLRSHARQRRADIARLHLIGLPRTVAAILTAVPLFAAGLAGALVGAAAWLALIRPNLIYIPTLGGLIFPEQLVVPARIILIAFAIPILLVVSSLLVVGRRPERDGIGGREQSVARPRPTLVGLLMLSLTVLGTVALFPGRIAGNTKWSLVLLIGCLLFAVGMMSALPSMLSYLATSARRASSTAVFLAGRRLRRDATGVSRLVAMCAVLYFGLLLAVPLAQQIGDPGEGARAQASARDTLLVKTVFVPEKHTWEKYGHDVANVEDALPVFNTEPRQDSTDGIVPVTCDQFQQIVSSSDTTCQPGPVMLINPALTGLIGPSTLSLAGEAPVKIRAQEASVAAASEMFGYTLWVGPLPASSPLVFGHARFYLLRSGDDPLAQVNGLGAYLINHEPVSQLQSFVLSAYLGAADRSPSGHLAALAAAPLLGLCLAALVSSARSGWRARESQTVGLLAIGADPKVIRRSFTIEVAAAIVVAGTVAQLAAIVAARASSRITGASSLSLSGQLIIALGTLAVAGGLPYLLVRTTPLSFSVEALRAD